MRPYVLPSMVARFFLFLFFLHFLSGRYAHVHPTFLRLFVPRAGGTGRFRRARRRRGPGGTQLSRKPDVKAVLFERAISKSNAVSQLMKVIEARPEPAIQPHPTPEEVLSDDEVLPTAEAKALIPLRQSFGAPPRAL
jgi:hypothetical protein